MSKWEMVRLGDVATYVNGFAFKPADWSNKGIPIIRIQNLTGTSDVVNYYDKKYSTKYEINNGDVLISWSASLGVYEWKKGKALLNQHIFKVVFDKLVLDKRFFVFVIAEKLREMSSLVHGSTMKHITKKYFDRIEIQLPPLESQKKIATALDSANALIEKRKEQIEKLDFLIKSQFIEMFGDPVTNPKGWYEEKLCGLGYLNRGVSKHRPRNDSKLLGGIYPLIQTGDVASAGLYIKDYRDTYTEIGLAQSKLWEKGTLCITIAANIAKTGILVFDACFPDSVVGFLANSNKTNNIFVLYWFKFFQKILENQAPESAQKNINLKILRELEIICPPLYLQTQFAEFVEKVEAQKTLLQKSLADMEQNYQSLLQKCFKGEIF
ncbi:restriction endonuclease subunit S [Phascolarctobacterium faecium]|uniref:restriction endonuclease subunit S n=1 Tax=Phascolarctobacterium faecium TaxID=33025 RepID=UPI003AF118F4